MKGFAYALAATALTVAAVAGAQDTRTVAEPKVPIACATLTAALTPVADTTLAEADERKLDTAGRHVSKVPQNGRSPIRRCLESE